MCLAPLEVHAQLTVLEPQMERASPTDCASVAQMVGAASHGAVC
jgi:hypothetical protein